MERRATANIWRNPNGTRTAEVYPKPINFLDNEGKWRPIESTLVRAGGGYQNKAGSFRARFSDRAAAPAVAELRGPGWSVGLGVPGASAVEAVATKNRVSYPGALSATDVEFHVLSAGVEQQFVLHEPPTGADAGRWRLSLTLSGVTAAQGEDGVVTFTTVSGEAVARIPQGVAFDSADRRQPPQAPAETPVAIALVEGRNGPELALSVDPEWLRAPERVYPVRVDPWVAAGDGGHYDHDAYVSSSCGSCTYNSSSQWNGYAYVNKIGRRPGQVDPEFYAYVYYDLGFANGQNIWSAKWSGHFDVRDGPDAFTMWRAAGSWSPSTVTWNNKPGHYSGAVAGAGTGWIDRDITSWVHDWTHGAMANNGLVFNTSGNFTYYEFRSDEEETRATGGQNRLEVTYDLPPNAPTNLSPTGVRVGSRTPSLSAKYSDPNGEAGTCWFEVWNSAFNIQMVRLASTQVSSGSTCAASVPSGYLAYGTLYYWRVQARAADGLGGQWGGFSGWANFTTPTTPSAPGSPAASASGCTTSADVSWTAPSDNGGMTITGYRIRALNPDGSYAGITNTVSGSTRATTITGLARGASYKFGIAASNSAGYGPEAVTATLTVVTTPGAPQSVSASGNPDGTSATITWNVPPSNGGSAISSYVIRAYDATTGTFTGQEATAGGTATTVQVSGLAQGSSYRFGVAATNCAGTGTETMSPDVTTVSKPSAPQNPTATGGVGRIDASWSAPATTGDAAVTGYTAELWHAASNTTTGQTRPVCGTCYSTEFTGLPSGAGYYFTVTATNSAGTGPAAESNTATTAVAPAAPTNVAAANAVEAGSASVTWSPPPSDGGDAISSYRIRAYIADTGEFTGIEASACGTCTAATISGLLPSRRYHFGVAATNGAGTSGEATSNAITTPAAFTAAKSATAFESGPVGKGEVVTYTVTLTNQYPTPEAPATFFDTLPAGVAAEGTSVSIDGTSLACGLADPGGTLPACLLQPAAADGTRILEVRRLPAFTGTKSLSYAVVLVGGDRNCDQVVNAVAGGDSGGGAFSANAPVTFCDTGLGRERWFNLVTRDLGPQGAAHINPANGNVVVQQTDSEPIQAHGRLAFVLRRTYNSQDTTAATLPGSFGAGWLLNIGQADDLAIDGVTPNGLYVPALAAAVKDPLSVTLVDRDGTRHVFRPKGLAAPVPASMNAATAPTALKAPAGATLCIDQTYSPPPGVHLALWRYLQVTSSDPLTAPCTPAAGTEIVVAGFGAIRPDRLRYEFDSTGRMRQMSDGAGVTFRYLYEAQTTIAGLVPHLTAVYEPKSCRTALGAEPETRDEIPSTCRAYRITYPSEVETQIVDPAGRLTKYTFDVPTGGPKRLASVTNPDGSTLAYTYGGTNCPANLLCSARDPRGEVVTFRYETPTVGVARATAVTDRNGSTTTIAYGADAASFTEGDHVQQFSAIDSAGRVGRTDEGNATTALRTTHYGWDTTAATCRDRDNRVDNNLCRRVREAKNDTQTSQTNGISTVDEVTTALYNPEGLPLRESIDTGDSGWVTTTYGYAVQQTYADGTTQTTTDAVAGSGGVTSGTRGDSPALLYTLADRTQALSPRGNAAGTAFAAHLTTYTVDNNATVAPNDAGDGLCAGTNGNTGVICAENTPPTNSDSAQSTTRHSYDRFGQRVTTTTPKAGADPAGPSVTSDTRCPVYSGVRLACTVYTYYADGDVDITEKVSAGGWLKGVTDPTGSFVTFAYDEAGHQIRAWDRNATAGHALTGSWMTAPPSQNYSEKRYTATMYPADATTYSGAWRYETSNRDALRDPAHPSGNRTTFTLDKNGNRVGIRTPRGNAAATTTYDTTQTFDGEDNLLTQRLPSGAATDVKWTWTYDAFDNRRTQQDPNGHRRAWSYDTVNRLTETRWARGTAASDAPGCPQDTTTGQFLSGLYVCSATTSYDGVNNAVSTRDADGNRTDFAYDGAHRLRTRLAPRDNTTTGRTEMVYDADGNATSVCPPRQFTEGSGTCSPAARFGSHSTYTPAGLVETATTYRAENQPKTDRFRYDANGNLTQGTDANLKATKQDFDLQDRLVSRLVPRTATTTNATTWAYDPAGNVTAVTKPGDPVARITAYTYDANNRVVDTVVGSSSPSAADAGPATGTENIRTRVAYDSDGNVVARFDPRAFATSATTPDARYMVRTDIDVGGRPTAQWVPRYDDQAASDVDVSASQEAQCPTGAAPQPVAGVPAYPAGVGVCVTRLAYDPAGNRTQLVLATSSGLNADGTNRDNRYVAFTYTHDNLPATVTAPSPKDGTHTTPTARYVYEPTGRERSRTDALGGARTTSYYRDGLVRQTDETGYTVGGRTVTHVTNVTYDANGNPKDVTDPAGSVSRSTYFADNLVADTTVGANAPDGGSTTRYTYDNVGNPLQVASPSAVRKDATNPVGTPATYDYFDDNLVKTATQPVKVNADPLLATARRTDYSYDSGGRKTAETVTMTNGSGTPLPGGDGGSQRFEYSPADRMTAQRGRNNEVITTAYDAAGNRTKITDSTTATTPLNATYYLDGLTRTVEDGATGAEDGHRLQKYAYDASGALAGRGDRLAAAGAPIIKTTYANNDAGLPSEMTTAFLGGNAAFRWTYDDDGRPTKETGPNGTVIDRVFNPDDTLATQTTTTGTATVSSWSYQYDNNGRIIEQDLTSVRAAATGQAVTGKFGYRYDTVGRVDRFTDTNLGATRTRSLTWDADGNRLAFGANPQACPSAADTACYTYNADDSLDTITNPAATPTTNQSRYDNVGRLDGDACTTYGYDGFDRTTRQILTANALCGRITETNLEFLHDGLDRQARRTESTAGVQSSTAKLHYDGLSSQQLSEVSTGAISSSGVYVLDATANPKAVDTASTSTNEFLYDDGAGNTTEVLDQDGRTTCTARFDPFGTPLGLTTADPNDVCNSGGDTRNDVFYGGARRDNTTGQYQMGSRLYDPTRAGFTTPDTYRGGDAATSLSVGTDPLTLNRYSYVNGDPVNLVDPDGHAGCSTLTFGWAKKKCKQVKRSGTRAYSRLADADIGGARLRDWASGGAGFDIFKDVGKGAVNFGAGLIDGTTSAVTLGYSGTKIGPVYKDKHLRHSYNIGKVTGHVEVGLATAGVGAALKTAAAVRLATTGRATRAIASSRAGSSLAGATTNAAIESVSNGATRGSVALAFGVGAVGGAAIGRAAPRATSLADDGLALCRTNSFVPATLVLMAGGTTKPIADVSVGDMVLATVPETGERGPRRVTDTIIGDGIKELVDIEVDGEVITATDRHPFWADDEGRWVDAEDLQAGDVLLLADGDTVTVDAVRERTEVSRVHNLTVDDIHTYYVLVGDAPVLVHNCGTASPNEFLRTEALSGRPSSRTVNEIADSMQADGWVGDPIETFMVNGDRYVINGHHRVSAARRAGIDVQYRTLSFDELQAYGYRSADDVIAAWASRGPDRLRP